MSKKPELTKEQQEFIAKTLAHRKEKVEELAYKALAISLKGNIPIYELPYYVLQRARKIIEEAFVKVNFTNSELQKARQEFLKVCLEEIKKNVVVAEEKEVKDETDFRDNQCEPIAQELVKLLLDEGLIFSDTEYFDKVLANEESVPLSAAIGGYTNALDEKLLMVISEHLRRANEKLWGVPKENITFEMLDAILKK